MQFLKWPEFQQTHPNDRLLDEHGLKGDHTGQEPYSLDNNLSEIWSTLVNTSVGLQDSRESIRVYPQDIAPNAMPALLAASQSLISSPIRIASLEGIPLFLRIFLSLVRLPSTETPHSK